MFKYQEGINDSVNNIGENKDFNFYNICDKRNLTDR